MEMSPFLARICILCFFLSMAAMLWLLLNVRRNISEIRKDIIDRCEGLKRLLFDVRDGTHTYHEEKREADRIRGSVTARVTAGGKSEFVKTVDISAGGIHITTHTPVKEGAVVDIALYLPLYVEPVTARARVHRILGSEDGPGVFEVGLEFISLPDVDRSRLLESLRVLGKR